MLREIILNILMFVPLGYLLYDIKKDRNRILVLITIISFLIEILQLLLHKGLFEFDDLVSNLLGGYIGILLCRYLDRNDKLQIREKLPIVFAIGSIIVSFGIVRPQTQILEREFFFQTVVANKTLQGDCFVIGKNAPDEYSIVLKKETETIALPTQTAIVQSEFNSYYESEYDYSLSGFTADISSVSDGTYEIFVDFKKYGLKETGCFLVDGEVVYTLNSGIQANNELTEHGYLLVAQNHCYVYQYQGNLYWIMDEEYPFEEDGTTYIQYQLWTTQPDKLPQNRIDNGWDWDNIGFNFEEYEINPIGNYRVAMRPLPTEYSITAIVTGYYKDGKWIWQKYFRPVMSELIQ